MDDDGFQFIIGLRNALVIEGVAVLLIFAGVLVYMGRW